MKSVYTAFSKTGWTKRWISVSLWINRIKFSWFSVSIKFYLFIFVFFLLFLLPIWGSVSKTYTQIHAKLLCQQCKQHQISIAMRHDIMDIYFYAIFISYALANTHFLCEIRSLSEKEIQIQFFCDFSLHK